jgi:hypothetical protein
MIPTPAEPKGHLYVAILNYRPELHHRVSDSLERLHWNLHLHHQWRCTRYLHIGHADICSSRNFLLSKFYYSPEYTHLLCVDGDVSWEPGTVERMIESKVEFILGAYPKRGDGEGFPIKFLETEAPRLVDPHTGEPDQERGLIRIKGGPGGLLMVSRAVIDCMVKAYPDAWYHYPQIDKGRCLSLFEFAVIDNKRISEDMNFCRLWRELDGDVWCDPHLKLYHHGDKTYAGRFIDELRLMMPKNAQEKIIKIPA